MANKTRAAEAEVLLVVANLTTVLCKQLPQDSEVRQSLDGYAVDAAQWARDLVPRPALRAVTPADSEGTISA